MNMDLCQSEYLTIKVIKTADQPCTRHQATWSCQNTTLCGIHLLEATTGMQVLIVSHHWLTYKQRNSQLVICLIWQYLHCAVGLRDITTFSSLEKIYCSYFWHIFNYYWKTVLTLYFYENSFYFWIATRAN